MFGVNIDLTCCAVQPRKEEELLGNNILYIRARFLPPDNFNICLCGQKEEEGVSWLVDDGIGRSGETVPDDPKQEMGR